MTNGRCWADRAKVSALLFRASLLASVSLAAAVHAQDAPVVGPRVSPSATSAASEKEIVVTGSRLVRRDLVAVSPVTTVDADQIQLSGNVTLEDTLNDFPSSSPATPDEQIRAAAPVC